MNRSHKTFTKSIRYVVPVLFIALIINIGILPKTQNTNEKIVAEQKESSIQSENKIEPSSNSNITAALNESEITINPDEDAVVNYNIKANDISSDSGKVDLSLPKDIIILYDTARSFTDNGIFNKLVSDTNLNEKYKTRYCVITYDSEATIEDPTKYSNFKKNDYDTTNLISDRTALNDYVLKGIKTTNYNQRNIEKALLKANQVFNQENDENVNRYIVIASSGKVLYNNDNASSILNKDCTVISLDLSNNKEDQSLKKLQQMISNEDVQEDDNYYYSTEANHNDINNSIMDKIREKILRSGGKRNPSFNDIYLNFDLANDLIAGEGLEKVSDSENKYRYKIKDIYYKYDKDSKKYKAYNKETNSYEDNFDISFSVKINYDIKKNFYNFGQTNTISYTGLSGQVNDSIDTPIINIQPILNKLNHGVYKGITKNSDNEYEIEENDNKIMKNGIANMYVSTKVYKNTNFILTIDENAEVDGNIEVYKIQNGVLNKLKADIKKQSNNVYSINITDNNVSNYDDVVILYNCREKIGSSKEKLTNNIKYGDKEKDADLIVQPLSEYPDLF